MAARNWDADVDLSATGAARLIEGQFPALAPAHLEPLGSGWDNDAYLVNARYVFRFPRRKMAEGLIVREARILPLLAPHLPVPIPAPAFVGRPEGDYPYPFAGYERISGVTACQVEWTDHARAALAEPLARFLRALHEIPVDDATRAWAPGDEIERANVARRVPMVRERLERIAGTLAGDEVEAVRAHVAALADTPLPTGPSCWSHGDLYPRHLLVGGEKRLCGMIDWGDVHLGDRGTDLSVAFSFLPPSARPAFFAAYGLPVDAAMSDRARFRGLLYGVILIDYGLDRGDDAIRNVGLFALRNARL